jgi:RNA polymerase sigma factor (sigma-70 family)
MTLGRIQGVVRDLCTLAEWCEGEGETTSRSDGQLLHDFAARRDESAFAVLVRRHGPMVFGVCRRVLRQLHDAEDAFQATFLVLARKAAALGHREILGNWLHGVALYTALKARAAALSRTAKEKTVARSEAIHETAGNEALAILDRELNLLPARYRAPIVLCDLEGKTYKEAAQQLACPEGTVAGRLSRARALLAKRLVRRGVTLTAGGLASMAPQLAPAAVPPLLAAQAVRAAAGPTSSPVSTLADKVLKAMLLTKLKILGVMILAVTLLGVLSAVGYYSFAGQEVAAEVKTQAAQQPPKNAAQEPGPKSAPQAQAKEKRFPLKNLPWQRPILLDKLDDVGEVDHGKEAKVWIDKALAMRGDAAVIPGFRPLTFGNLVIYRTYNDVRAVILNEDNGPAPLKAGDILWKHAGDEHGLANLLAMHPFNSAAERWLQTFPAADLPQLLLENGQNCATSIDRKRVYLVEDLPVPPPAGYGEKKETMECKNLIVQNVLTAVDLFTGKIVWKHGEENRPDPFAESHFLGAPYLLGGKLYVLNETNQGELRLVVLNPDDGNVLATDLLAKMQGTQRYLVNLQRRLNPVQLVEHNDLLVCMTHAGVVIGVETPKHKVRWTYTYKKDAAADPAKLPLGGWKTPAPLVRDGKLVFTAADDDHIHCVRLEDGQFLWKVKRADDLYVAGIAADKVLVVGNSACRALALKDGKEVWKLTTGTPSGVGVIMDKTTYLLPLKKGAASLKPEIAYLDIDQGRLLGTSPLKIAPGNLLLYGNTILSQSATTMTGYVRE